MQIDKLQIEEVFNPQIEELFADRRTIEAGQGTIFDQRTIFADQRAMFDRRTIFD